MNLVYNSFQTQSHFCRNIQSYGHCNNLGLLRLSLAYLVVSTDINQRDVIMDGHLVRRSVLLGKSSK